MDYDSNPLDTSRPASELVLVSRTGNLARAQELIQAGVNVNARDRFDYTPLLAASLCGHYEMVELLLESGAVAERNTFQGERCIYAALTDKIRNLLLRYDFSKSTDPFIYWSAHITSLLSRTHPPTSDVALWAAAATLDSATPSSLGAAVWTPRQPHSCAPLPSDSQPSPVCFSVHRFILTVRSEELASKLLADLSSSALRLAIDVSPASVRLFLRFLYLADMPTDPSSLTLPGERPHPSETIVRGAEALADHLGLCDRLKLLLPQTVAAAAAAAAAVHRRAVKQNHEDEVRQALGRMWDFFRVNVIGARVVVETDKADAAATWTLANPTFADVILRADFSHPSDEPVALLPLAQSSSSTMAHVSVDADAEKEENEKMGEGEKEEDGKKKARVGTGPRRCALYPVHKAMLIRSPFFETMFSSTFAETQPSRTLRVVKVDCAPDVLELVLGWMYAERAEVSLEWALDALYTADMLMMEPLKNRVVTAISTLGSRKKAGDQKGGGQKAWGYGGRGIDIGLKGDGQKSDEQRGDGQNSNGQKSNGQKGDDSSSSAAPTPEYYSEPINIYDVIHAAWELHVPKLETFAARYLAHRLEDYIDDADFSELIAISASRQRARQETDTIELLDDIRHYLSERFRHRFRDTGLREMVEDAQIQAERERGAEAKGQSVKQQAEVLASRKKVKENRIHGGAEWVEGRLTTQSGGPQAEDDAGASGGRARTMVAGDEAGGEAGGGDDDDKNNSGDGEALRAFNGQMASDELDLEEKNYLFLLGKIEDVLQRLNLSA